MDIKTSAAESADDDVPSPDDFVAYLPFACKNMNLVHNVIVVRNTEMTLTPVDKKSKSARPKGSSVLREPPESKALSDSMERFEPGTVLISAVYDKLDRLIQLVFDKRTSVSNCVLKVINLIIHFHQKTLQNVTISRRIDKLVISELINLCSLTDLTEIFLDGSYVPELNYYQLLEVPSRLKYLSLARCKVNDACMKYMAENMMHHNIGSKTLQLLNLSMNSITDEGAEYIAQMLRSNRKLAYLNLSGNLITDTGATAILNSLDEFPLTVDEISLKRSSYMEYLFRRRLLFEKTVQNLHLAEAAKQATPRRPSKDRKGKPVKEIVVESVEDRAEAIVTDTLGPFKHPFNKDDLIAKNDHMYCAGNNVLTYLNLSFNNLSFITLTKVIDVLKNQGNANRTPRGLVKIVLDGNNLPINCEETRELECILDSIAAFYAGKKTGAAMQAKKKMPR